MITTDDTTLASFQAMLEANEQLRRKEEFVDLVDEYEQITRCIFDQLTVTIDAEYDVGLAFPEFWLQSLRRLGEAASRSPSVIQCSEAPRGCEVLVALYNDWAGRCEYLADAVLRWVEAMEEGDCTRACDCKDEINGGLSATQAHTSARMICLGALGVELTTAYYQRPEPTKWPVPVPVLW